MSEGGRELRDLVNLVDKTPGWTVKELSTVWHVHPPLSDEHYSIKKSVRATATHLRKLGKDLERLGWTEAKAKAASKRTAARKTKAGREKAERKTAKLLEEAAAEPVQPALPLYEADVIGGPEHLPPGPLGDGKPYSVDNVLLTPELAEKLIAMNFEDNRPLSEDREAEIVGDILAGRWFQNGSRIRFCLMRLPDGQLGQRMVDGYTRCNAVKKAGVGVPVDFYYNMPPEALPTVDIERSRTPGNSLHMFGIPHANMKAAAIKMVWFYDTERPGRWSIRVSNPHTKELHDKDPEGWQTAATYVYKLLGMTAKDDKSIFVQRSLLSAYFVCLRAYPKNPRLNEFFDGVITGLGLPRDVGDPRYKLRRLLKNEATTGVTKQAKRHFALTIMAYNHFMQPGPKPLQLVWDMRDEVPDPVRGG